MAKIKRVEKKVKEPACKIDQFVEGVKVSLGCPKEAAEQVRFLVEEKGMKVMAACRKLSEEHGLSSPEAFRLAYYRVYPKSKQPSGEKKETWASYRKNHKDQLNQIILDGTADMSPKKRNRIIGRLNEYGWGIVK